MDLLAIRTQFVQTSGRYDLVVDAVDYVDRGANWYINQGQKSLERKMNVASTKAKVFKDLDIGTYLVTLVDCRAITGVWIMTEERKIPLIKIDPDRAKLNPESYMPALDSAGRAIPTYWYPTNLRRAADAESNTNTVTFGGEVVTFGGESVTMGYGSDSDTIEEFIDTVTPQDPTRSGLVIYPPTDIAYGIQVDGLFYNVALSSDDDINYWSVEHSALLIMAAMRTLEGLSRGSKKYADWTAIIDDEIREISMDAAEEESANIVQFKG